MERGATGTSTSFTTSRVTSRVCVRPPPPSTSTFPIFGKLEPPLLVEEDMGIGFANGLDAPPFEDFFFDEPPVSPFPPAPNTRNKTATITTDATVKNTMIAVSRNARGVLYNS